MVPTVLGREAVAGLNVVGRPRILTVEASGVSFWVVHKQALPRLSRGGVVRWRPRGNTEPRGSSLGRRGWPRDLFFPPALTERPLDFTDSELCRNPRSLISASLTRLL